MRRDDETQELTMRIAAAAGGIISWAAVAYGDRSARDDARRTRELAANFGVDDDTGYELVVAADAEVEAWLILAGPDRHPDAAEWSRRAATIAAFLVNPRDRAAARTFAGLDPIDAGRDDLIQARPLAAGYGACARAAAVATLLPKLQVRIDEMVNRTLGAYAGQPADPDDHYLLERDLGTP